VLGLRVEKLGALLHGIRAARLAICTAQTICVVMWWVLSFWRYLGFEGSDATKLNK